MYDQDTFVEHIQDSVDYIAAGNEKKPDRLASIQEYITEQLVELAGGEESDLLLQSGGVDIPGAYLSKEVPIAMYKEGQIVLCVSTSLANSGFVKNASNKFHDMVGVTANIQSSEIKYVKVIVLPTVIPDKDRNGNITARHDLTAAHVRPYLNLMQDDEGFHQPFAIGICLISIDPDGRVTAVDPFEFFEEPFAQQFQENLSMDALFDKLQEFVEQD